jgi:hypothetical protein
VARPDIRQPQEGAGGGVSGSVEASRRHGPFDSRGPKRPLRDRLTIALPGFEDVPDGLDWDAFSTRYFPGRGRHDLDAIAAYDAYQQGRRWRESSRPKKRRSIGLNEPVLSAAGRAPRVRRASLSRPGATR